MAGPFHAVAIVALAVVAAAVCVRFYRRPRPLRVLGAAAAAVAAALGTASVSLHACDLGQPFLQWLVPAAGVGAVLALVGHALARRAVIGLLVVGGLALSLQYAAEVHGEVFVGTPELAREHGLERAEAEWHTPISGLYRRVPGVEPAP